MVPSRPTETFIERKPCQRPPRGQNELNNWQCVRYFLDLVDIYVIMEEDGTQQQQHRESPKRRTSGQQQQGGAPYPQMGYMPHMGTPMHPQHMRHPEMMQVRLSWGDTHVNHVDF